MSERKKMERLTEFAGSVNAIKLFKNETVQKQETLSLSINAIIKERIIVRRIKSSLISLMDKAIAF